jgi:hypothetical protein
MIFKRTLIIFAILISIFGFCNSALAYSGNTGDVTPTPNMTAIYYPETWSNGECTWDFTQSQWNYIPKTAEIGAVQLIWNMIPSSGYSGAHVALFNSDYSTGYYMPNNILTNTFEGEPFHQVFKCKFWVEQKQYPGQALYCVPKLLVYYDLP